jgi:CRISPR-associated protein Cmr1
MERATFDVQLVTPCFLGDAKQDAEWRAASIRGHLRWWYRAVAGEAHAGDLSKVKEGEERIFGSARRSAALRVRALNPSEAIKESFGDRLSAQKIATLWGEPAAAARLQLQGGHASNPLHYLGYGPIDKGTLKRDYLPPKAETCFELQWNRTVPEEWKTIFERSLWAWLHLGGLGVRSRKGFGSLRLMKVDGDGADRLAPPETREKYLEQARSRLPLGSTHGALPEWTHFSANSRIYLGTERNEGALDAMERLGAWLIGFRRRYGSPTDNRPLRKDGTGSLSGRDYTWAAPNGKNPRGGFPDRAGFGLPLPFKRNITPQYSVGESVLWEAPGGDPRRASPLLLHVARLGDEFVPVLTYLPARFLPPNGKLYFEGHPGNKSSPTAEQLDVVERFLDDLAAKKLIERVTP